MNNDRLDNEKVLESRYRAGGRRGRSYSLASGYPDDRSFHTPHSSSDSDESSARSSPHSRPRAFGSKYTSFVSVPPMSMPNQGIAA
jgi:hypothetical protein